MPLRQNMVVVEQKGNILDKSNDELKISLSHDENFSGAMITDSIKNILGKFSMISNVQFGLSNAQGITILRSTEKEKLTSFEYSLNDREGNLIGIVKKKGLLKVNYSIEKEGSIILKGEKSGGHITIKAESNKKIGIIEFGREAEKKYFNLKIEDSAFGRLTLLGFYLSMYHNRFRWVDPRKIGEGGGE